MREFAWWCVRMGAWFASMAVLGFAVGLLTGCTSDCQNPFEAPDATVQPVDCAAQGCAK